MSADQIYVGIDGGGSSTRALITDADSKPLSYGEAGPSNPNTVGCASAAREINLAYSRSRPIDHQNTTPTAVYCGIAGIVSSDLAAELSVELCKYGWISQDHLTIDHDLAIAFEGGLLGEPGLVLIAGTGSSAYGVGAGGTKTRTSGRRLGNEDPGSAYAIGSETLKRLATNRSDDLDRFASQISQYIGDANPVELLADRRDRARIAAAARGALDAAGAGDAWSTALLGRQANALAELAVLAARELFPNDEPFPLVLQGSLIASPSLYRDQLESILVDRLPNAVITPPATDPLRGACLLARARAQATLDKQEAVHHLSKPFKL